MLRRIWRTLSAMRRIGWAYVVGDSRHLFAIVYQELAGLGGVYVKFLQILALRFDGAEELGFDPHDVFEHVGLEPLDARARLAEQFGAHSPLQLVSPEPVAAGSLGQVYRAILGGQPVAVKCLRPEVQRFIRLDLRLLGLVAAAVQWVSTEGMINFAAVFSDFKQATLAETDYLREARLAGQLFAHYEHHPAIVLPRTYLDFCTSTILVQDWLEGPSVARLLQMRSAGEISSIADWAMEHLGTDLNLVFEALGVDLLTGVIRQGLIQADPHPGNLIVLSENRLGIVDFGIVATPPKRQQAFVGLLREYVQIYRGVMNVEALSLAILRYFAGDLVAALETVSFATHSPRTAESILAEVGKTAQQQFDGRRSSAGVQHMIRSFRITRLFATVINADNRFGLNLELEATSMLRAAQIYMTLVDRLDLDKQRVIGQTFERAVALLDAEGGQLGSSAPLGLNRSFEIVAGWVDRVAMRDPMLSYKIGQQIRKRQYA